MAPIPNFVNVKQVDKSLRLPQFETEGSCGFDLLTREEARIDPGKICMIPANIIVQVPKGFVLFITLRSSAPEKFGVTMPHGIGVIDQDYCGEDDEIKILVQNIRDETIVIPRESRIAQGVFVSVLQPHWNSVNNMRGYSRGGFGSTG